ncbi:MAG TPA: Spy/CpxP family protein refolding chaperone [Burkholderiaceae bacterium]|nr:Spy/CpxP family protein refolding chaperone [Burkholderiaceae bacterium]
MSVKPRSLTPMRGARLLALACVVALSGAYMSVAHAQPAMGPAAGPMMFGHGPHGGRGLERMLDGINASADQRSRIHDIVKAAQADLRNQREASRGLRERAMTLFAQPTVDANAVEALRQQMLQQHDAMSRRWTQAMLDAAAVLTPEQRKQLVERMQQRRDMMQRHQQERRAIEQPKG